MSKETKLERFRITLVLSAHMFYTVFIVICDTIFNFTNTALSGIMKHSDKLESVIPDKALDWFKKVKTEADTREESFKAAKNIVENSFKSIGINISSEKSQDNVKEKDPITVDKVEIRKNIREKIDKGEDVGVNKYIGSIINITIGDIHIHNIENITELIGTLKDLSKRVDSYDHTDMTMEELVDLKSRIDTYISNREYENNTKININDLQKEKEKEYAAK